MCKRKGHATNIDGEFEHVTKLKHHVIRMRP